MNKLKRVLRKFTRAERKIIIGIIKKVLDKNSIGLDIKKLKGSNNVYRVRKGKIRIIYQSRDNDIQIIAIERRSEKTYRDH